MRWRRRHSWRIVTQRILTSRCSQIGPGRILERAEGSVVLLTGCVYLRSLFSPTRSQSFAPASRYPDRMGAAIELLL